MSFPSCAHPPSNRAADDELMASPPLMIALLGEPWGDGHTTLRAHQKLWGGVTSHHRVFVSTRVFPSGPPPRDPPELGNDRREPGTKRGASITFHLFYFQNRLLKSDYLTRSSGGCGATSKGVPQTCPPDVGDWKRCLQE